MKNVVIIIGVVIVFVILFMEKDNITKVITSMTRKQFIDKFAPVVKNVSSGTGLFPSLFIAQAILESNNGNSTLSQQHNNFFGIKADSSWKGAKVVMSTHEYVNGVKKKIDAAFRKYSNPVDSFNDRVKFLRGFSRYSKVFNAVSPYQQAVELQKAGYATDPNYANLLRDLMEQNNLYKYDA